MKTTTLQLLPTTTYGTPSGNYDGSSEDWSGEQQQAANYYGGFGDLQTVAFFLLNFQGLIRIQATLDQHPVSDAAWFDVEDFDSVDSATTDNFSRNITGNFVWIRARVEDFSTGTITKLMLSY
jgi:hypothetical protein